jgi:hypothetical protein
MELMKSARKHGSLLSETIYFLLNIGLAGGVLLLVSLFPNLPILAYIFVLLSKWRVLAVRPRFWWDNFQANFLDLLLGVSVVTMLWQAREEIFLQIVITVLYAVWLVALKPMASRMAMQIQATVAQFVAITALLGISFAWPSWAVVIGMWVIGYVAARHILVAYEEDDITFLSLIWGLVAAELGWVTYHWTIAYSFGSASAIFKIPQTAIIVTLLGYLVAHGYSVYKNKHRIRLTDIIWPALFVLATVTVLLAFFNGIDQNNF